MVINVVDENGNEMELVEFVIVGFVVFDMFVGNDEVIDFFELVEVEVGINLEIIDLVIGQQVKEGDIIFIWLFDDNIGQWKYEGEAVVEKDVDGNFSVMMLIIYFLWWNFDYFYNFCCWYELVWLVIEFDYNNYWDVFWFRG